MEEGTTPGKSAEWTSRHMEALRKYFPQLKFRQTDRPGGKKGQSLLRTWGKPEVLTFYKPELSGGLHETAHAFYGPERFKQLGVSKWHLQNSGMSDDARDEFLATLVGETSEIQQGRRIPRERWVKPLVEHGPRLTGSPEHDVGATKDFIHSVLGVVGARLQPSRTEAFQYGNERTPEQRAQALGRGFKAWEEYLNRRVPSK
jgi:hypothetical protein